MNHNLKNKIEIFKKLDEIFATEQGTDLPPGQIFVILEFYHRLLLFLNKSLYFFRIVCVDYIRYESGNYPNLD
jgi:hypothetical protein